MLIVGPDGARAPLEASETGMGISYVVPYLQSVGINAASGSDYAVAGHQHCDHLGGSMRS